MADEPIDDEPVINGVVDAVERFGSESEKVAAQQGREAARDEVAEHRANILENIAVSVELITAWDDAYDTSSKRSMLFKAGAVRLAHDVLTGRIEIKGAQVAQVFTALVTAGRLEAGEVTSSTQTVATNEERLERMQTLREEAESQIEAAKKAAEAGKVVGLGG